MANISNLTRQHRDVEEIVSQIKALSSRKDVEQNAAEIAQKLSTLVGKLKIHLETEDKILYPSLLECNEVRIKEIATKYINEMSNISVAFMDYKNKYNTKSKILNNVEGFISESEEIFKVLGKRVAMEDTELYPLLK